MPAFARTPSDVRQWITDELRSARSTTDPWPALERAHIVSQPWAWPHTRVHLAMLRAGLAERDRSEIVGQIIRILVAAPGSLSGRYPAGNSGRSAMPLTATAPVPDDLAALLPSQSTPGRTDS